ncbi:MAG: Glyoxalase/bleomycin resistance protein/dioxygenase [Lacunisphaera sp.]|nr:Glyoxalase/bleomycin resistance protein/dioxygenase [Lacunisphaera sp.]MDB6166583.1 Glyoxalase/bleomycin resistance protein/dioxygenase [Lacunisphaera sp.]
MPPSSFHRPGGILAALFALSLALPAFAGTPTFQPLHSPPTGEQHPGKFVWADLFTTDPVAATKFYSGLFGWTANTIDQGGKAYTVFSNGKRPVAGLAPRNTANKKRGSRWISYIAVSDLNATVSLVSSAGGQVRAPARDFPDRGMQAILTDNEGSPVGLLQSRSGDSRDDEPQPGDWQWFELYAKQPKAATDFYAHVLHYAVIPDRRTERKNDWLLLTGDSHRAGVAPMPENEDAAPGWLGVVRIRNMDEMLARVTKLGGEVLVNPRAAAYESRFAIIADSTGGTVGLVEYVENNSNSVVHP